MSTTRFTRRCAYALAVTTLALTLAGAAGAAVVYPSFAPTLLTGPPPWTTTYSIELDTGPGAEQLVFSGPGSIRLDGPGTVSQALGQLGSAIRACSGGRGTTVASTFDTTYYQLDLPPWSHNVLVAEVVQAKPLPLGADLGYQFFLGPSATQMQRIDVGEPQVKGPRAVPLSLSSTLTSATPGPAQVASGTAIPLRGRATPLLAGQTVELRYTTVWPARWQRVARVRVRRDGSYAAQWRPPAAGLYTFSVRYRSRDSRFLSGSGPSGCPPTVQVTRRR